MLADVPKPQSTAYVEEVDDPSVPVPTGASCKRKSCKISYDGSARAEEVCQYHPGAPIFHEGSKGWSCCKRRVMDFDDFLRIEGCKTRSGEKSGAHLFVGAKRADEVEMVECRTDHYQTPTQVIVSVFGKGADKEASSVVFEEESVGCLLLASGLARALSNSRRHRLTLPFLARR